MEQEVADRFVAVETRLSAVEDGTSLAAATAAKADAAATAAVAAVVRAEAAVVELTRKVDSLTVTQKTQLDILIRLDAVAANPHFKVILAIVATVLASWAASKGFN